MVEEIVIEQPAIDYLTLVSFEEEEERRLFDAFWRCGKGEPEESRQMQYRGSCRSNVFIGLAEVTQEVDKFSELKRKHVMMRSWGAAAHEILDYLAEGEAIKRCRRIDVQITIPYTAGYRARNLIDSLDCEEWVGRKRKLELREDGGLDTVYIGSRTSDRFIRIYVKEIAGIWYLRFEVEYTGDRATPIYHACHEANRKILGGILRKEAMELPQVADVGLLAIREALYYDSVHVSLPKRVQTEDGRLKWLRGSVDPVIRRAINDHDEGQDVRKMVEGWYRLIQDLDKSRIPYLDKNRTA